MTLLVEIESGGTWRLVGSMQPNDPHGSISHHDTEGRRHIYRFHTEPERSIIERSLGGADGEIGPARLVMSVGFERVALLDARNPTLELPLQTDRMTSPHLFRFRHED